MTGPTRVFVFSGHMVDAPGRAEPRFPAAAVPEAARRIGQALDAHGAGPDDLALTQGAAGGDLLFAEACLARGVPLELLLPLPEDEFVRQSLRPSDPAGHWVARYQAVRAHLAHPPRKLGDDPAAAARLQAHGNPFERCNLWLIDEAFARARAGVCFVCLWNGVGGDGPGGTAHLVAEVRRRGGQVDWIDSRTLSAAQPDVPRPAAAPPGASHSS